MEIQELRVGNIVRYGNPIHKNLPIHKVTGVLSNIIYLDGELLSSKNSNIIGIPLSEEILLKCGFEIKPFSLGLTLDRFRFIWKPEYKYWYVVDKYSNSYLTKIEFVHELQNFVFVMTGQELNTSRLINTNNR